MNQFQAHAQAQVYSEFSSYEKIKRLLDFEKGPALKILDVGSGSGRLCKELAAFGHQVTGIDVSPATTLARFKFIAADLAQAWPLPEQAFDVVVCTDVAEHLYDPAHVLRETGRVLKPDGSLIFGVPNHFDLRQRLRMLFGNGIIHWDNLRHGQKAWSYVHIRFFTLPELLELFKEEGWVAEKIQLNFMGGGIVPTRFTPRFFRYIFLKLWPNLFSGKFVFLLKKSQSAYNRQANFIYLNRTPQGY